MTPVVRDWVGPRTVLSLTQYISSHRREDQRKRVGNSIEYWSVGTVDINWRFSGVGDQEGKGSRIVRRTDIQVWDIH